MIPHLLVPDLRDALCRTPGQVVVSMNLEPHMDETRGYDLADHLDVLLRHAPDLRVHTVLADPTAVHDRETARRRGGRAARGPIWRSPTSPSDQPGVHDPQKLGRRVCAVLRQPN